MAKARVIPRATPAIEIVRKSPQWRRLAHAEATVRDAIAAAAGLAVDVPVDCAVTVVLTDDGQIRVLNKAWRGIDKATNVLSFPVPETPPRVEAPQFLGDIVIAYSYLVREAEMERKAPLAHLAHLAVHGFLHLVGYDHVFDEGAEEMERLEARILATLGLPDPYGKRARVRAINP